MKRKGIPSDADFARASAAMRKRSKGLSNVRDRIKIRFFNRKEFYEFFIIDCFENSFRAYVFYRLNSQILVAEKSGLSSEIINAVYEEIETVGRGDRKTIKVEFEFDSNENIEENYEGDYYMRLR